MGNCFSSYLLVFERVRERDLESWAITVFSFKYIVFRAWLEPAL